MFDIKEDIKEKINACQSLPFNNRQFIVFQTNCVSLTNIKYSTLPLRNLQLLATASHEKGCKFRETQFFEHPIIEHIKKLLIRSAFPKKTNKCYEEVIFNA